MLEVFQIPWKRPFMAYLWPLEVTFCIQTFSIHHHIPPPQKYPAVLAGKLNVSLRANTMKHAFCGIPFASGSGDLWGSAANWGSGLSWHLSLWPKRMNNVKLHESALSCWEFMGHHEAFIWLLLLNLAESFCADHYQRQKCKPTILKPEITNVSLHF